MFHHHFVDAMLNESNTLCDSLPNTSYETRLLEYQEADSMYVMGALPEEL